MLFKCIGAAIIGITGTLLGFYYSHLGSRRIQDLMEFKKALLILSSEIEYMQTALPEACEHIAQKINKPAGSIFSYFAKSLAENKNETTQVIWTQSIERHKNELYLAEEDRAVLYNFGKTLGYLDKQMQINAIKLSLSYIDSTVASLQFNNDKNVKMYRSLGLLGGLLLSVVLW